MWKKARKYQFYCKGAGCALYIDISCCHIYINTCFNNERLSGAFVTLPFLQIGSGQTVDWYVCRHDLWDRRFLVIIMLVKRSCVKFDHLIAIIHVYTRRTFRLGGSLWIRARGELLEFIDISVNLSRLMKYVAGGGTGKYRYFHGRLATSIASA